MRGFHPGEIRAERSAWSASDKVAFLGAVWLCKAFYFSVYVCLPVFRFGAIRGGERAKTGGKIKGVSGVFYCVRYIGGYLSEHRKKVNIFNNNY